MSIRPIAETLNRLGAGLVMDEAAEKLAAAVQAVGETGKAASVTIKIDLRKATAGALAVSGSVAVKLPATPKHESLMFPTPEGNLLAEDPRQQKLELRTIETATPQVA